MPVDKIGELFTPSLIKADMAAINNGVDSLARDIQEAGLANTRYAEEYARFALEWREFYKNNDGWLSRSLNKTAATVKAYADRLRQWRDKARGMGFEPTTPTPAVSQEDKIPWGKLAIGAGIATVGILAWKAYNPPTQESVPPWLKRRG
jgi:hypothetical protein